MDENIKKDQKINSGKEGGPARRSQARPLERQRGGEGGHGRRSQGEGQEFDKKVLQVDRISRTVKGGRRIRFRALVIMGNHNGKVGIGVGKAAEVVDAVEKGSKLARKNLINVPIFKGTIPHQIELSLGAAHILLKPAKAGTSIVAGGTIRAICDLAGIQNIVGKILGTANKINNSKATIEAFEKLTKEKNAPEITKNSPKEE